MGNLQSEPRPSSSSASLQSGCSQATSRIIQRVCPLSTFTSSILGGPIPPSPGLIPLCWEDLLDWTADVISISDKVYQNSRDHNEVLGGFVLADAEIVRSGGVRFVPYVSVCRSDEDLRKLSSLSYMERAQFYQESVVIAVKKTDSEDVLCLISLFQFCRYFTLIRRLADAQNLVLEYDAESNHPENGMLPEDDDGGSPDERTFLLSEQLLLSASAPPRDEQHTQGQDCVICLDRAEDSVLHCCSQAICADCERRWVRKRLRCPFCRQSFASVKEAVQTQWQLSSAIPVELVMEDVRCLSEKVNAFWQGLGIEERSVSDQTELADFLKENYVQRDKIVESNEPEEEEWDGFIVVQACSFSEPWPLHEFRDHSISQAA